LHVDSQTDGRKDVQTDRHEEAEIPYWQFCDIALNSVKIQQH